MSLWPYPGDAELWPERELQVTLLKLSKEPLLRGKDGLKELKNKEELKVK